jgi:hypothetical protein
MLNAPIAINLYERTLTTSVGTFIEDLAPRATSYQHTISATCGFESMTVTLPCSLLDAQRYCERLFAAVIVYGADADIAWEGYLAGVSYRVGDETINYTLDAMANRVRVRYTTVNGVPAVTAPASHTGSQALYGVKDVVQGVNVTTTAAAEALRDTLLAERRLPRPQLDSAIATGQSEPAQDVTLSFAGWYTTLEWVVTSRTDTTTEATTTQVGALIGTASPGIGATNPFLSTSTARIVASGVTDTRKIEVDTPYRAKIEALLQQGNSSNQRFAWGVYEGRVFVVDVWAGATPTVSTYRRRIGDATLETGNGALVMPWAVRPNAMLETTDILNVGPPSGAIDLPGRQFVERWTCAITADGWSLTPEAQATNSIDARLARLG